VPDDIITTLRSDANKLDGCIKPFTGMPLTFKTVKERITLKPLYDIHGERYVVYWDLK
jgi:hypothetical protein